MAGVVNKVVFNGKTLIDLSDLTVTTADVLAGKTAITKAGVKITGMYNPPKIATGTVTVTSSSPSSTGSLSITMGAQFIPKSLVMCIEGTGSTNSVCSVTAINTSTATYTRTTSGTATSSPGTKAITYTNGIIIVPQYNSNYNFKVGKWRWVAWA